MNLVVSRLPIVPALIVVAVGLGCSTPDREPATERPAVTAPGLGPDWAEARVTKDADEAESRDVAGRGGPLTSFHVTEYTTVAALFNATRYYPGALRAAGFSPDKTGPWDTPSEAIAALQSISEKVEEGDCRFTPPSLQVCDLVDKATGRVVARSTRAGGTRHVETDYVIGKGFFAQARSILEHDVR